MNAYFENSNTSYTGGRRTRELNSPKFGDGLISFICAIIGLFTCPAAIALEKTAVVFALFLSFVAVVGAIEGGALSMLLGILICGAISLSEYAMLKSIFKRSKKDNYAKRI